MDSMKLFEETPLLGILRGITAQDVLPLADVIIDAGLTTVEITMNTVNAADLIKQMCVATSGKVSVGAGTVLTLDQMHTALDAGAEFIVMPTLQTDVVEYCAKNDIPVFPGALTPQEIYDAWNAGAYMVKVFPAKFFGPTYFKEIKAPFNDIKLLACGGVSADNMSEFFDCGADGVAFGGSVFDLKKLGAGDIGVISQNLKKMVDAYRK